MAFDPTSPRLFVVVTHSNSVVVLTRTVGTGALAYLITVSDLGNNLLVAREITQCI